MEIGRQKSQKKQVLRMSLPTVEIHPTPRGSIFKLSRGPQRPYGKKNVFRIFSYIFLYIYIYIYIYTVRGGPMGAVYTCFQAVAPLDLCSVILAVKMLLNAASCIFVYVYIYIYIAMYT